MFVGKNPATKTRKRIASAGYDLQSNGYDFIAIARNRETGITWTQCSESFWEEYKVRKVN
jgi:hypothetical protein